MATENKVEPTGTGQEGAGSPAHEEVPIHIEGGKPVNKVDELANRAARKGAQREHREDPSIFTK